MEVSALTHAGVAGTHARSPLLRLQSDERLIGLIRRGNHHAFEALVARYQSRLLAFCRHMLSSREDAEDVLQEVFAAAFNAILGDEREINVRPWLYRIARNRSLNHLRKAQAIGVDSMDVHLADHGLTTADKVHKREEFRQLMSDVQDLPETQRTALLLREIDALSFEQISEAMETTVPSVKSLLVRARVVARRGGRGAPAPCEQVRRSSARSPRACAARRRPSAATCARASAARRSASSCARPTARLPRSSPSDRCCCSRRRSSPTPAPPRPAVAARPPRAARAAAGAAGAAGAAAGGALQAGAGALATKAVAGLAAAAIVTAGAVEVKHAEGPPGRQGRDRPGREAAPAALSRRRSGPPGRRSPPSRSRVAAGRRRGRRAARREGEEAQAAAEPAAEPSATPTPTPTPAPVAAPAPTATPEPAPTTAPPPEPHYEQHEGDTIALPDEPTGRMPMPTGSPQPQPTPRRDLPPNRRGVGGG